MKLQHDIRATLGWCLSLGAKLMRVAPITTLTVQATILASQIFLLLAFFLPLKVIILLGSENIPNYFPSAFHSLKKSHLIISLSIASAVCYLLYLLSEMLISYCSRNGARSVLQRCGKLKLFENQEKIAAQVYSRFTRAMAAALFFFISTAVLLIIYPSLLATIMGYTVLAAFSCVRFYNGSHLIRKQLQQNYGAILNTLSAAGFLLSFFCLVVNFLYFPHQRIFHMVIAVLIMRQALQRLASMIQDIVSLRAQHRQINAMFFQSQPLVDLQQDNHQLERFLNPSTRSAWACDLMEQAGIKYEPELQIDWHQMDAVDVYAFRIDLHGLNGPETYLAKLYGTNISALAEQERLLIKYQPKLPSLEWLGHYCLDNIDCHLFRLDDHKKLTRRQIGEGVVAINRELMCHEPAGELLLRFTRSRPYLENRLERRSIERLSYACSDDIDIQKVEYFIDALPLIIQKIGALPRQIVSLDITSEALLISKSQVFSLSHWSNWRIEAIGCNWPVAEKERLREAVEIARSTRPDMTTVSTEDVELAALTYSFERLLQRKDYPGALKLLGDILNATYTDQSNVSNQTTVQ